MTNNKQQTAVEWFIEGLEEKGKAYEENQVVRTINICIDVSDYMELKVQAKEMEKEQQRKIYRPSIMQNADGKLFLKSFEQYYNETYGGGNK
ncbi:hypothetical protein [Runella sp.]|uniref:hypothetical protein n=1 Tax=Runella sp. TaxID=1960881 RepID=UPI0030186393